jgi:hypothetical protein
MGRGLLLAFTCASCASVQADTGSDALFRVEAGVFRRGETPESDGGPAVLGAYLALPRLTVGEQENYLDGVVEPDATAVVLGLSGDLGTWQVPVTIPPPEAPMSLGFAATFSLSADIEPGSHEILLWAVDGEGRAGEPTRLPVEILAPAAPMGALVVSLSWTGAADLDLHLVLPDGAEVFSGDPALSQGGELFAYLDFDSNAECSFDGRCQENILIPVDPPMGSYSVRVETRSLCGEPSAPFVVEVHVEGERSQRVEGTGLLAETRFPSGRGAGELVLTFDVP